MTSKKKIKKKKKTKKTTKMKIKKKTKTKKRKKSDEAQTRISTSPPFVVILDGNATIQLDPRGRLRGVVDEHEIEGGEIKKCERRPQQFQFHS